MVYLCISPRKNIFWCYELKILPRRLVLAAASTTTKTTNANTTNNIKVFAIMKRNWRPCYKQ